MSKLKKRLWMGTGVVVALAVVVAVVYAAYDVHEEGVKIEGDGIGMNTVPDASPHVINWPDGQCIKGSSIFGDALQVICDTGAAQLKSSSGSIGTYASAQTTGAYLLTATGFTIHAQVGTDTDGNAWIESVDGGSSVEATDDGDVVITLGS